RLLAETYFERGLALCEQGELHSGMLWLGRSLELTLHEATDLERVIRINLAAWRPHLTALRATLTHRAGTIAVSPDATKIATADYQSAQLWDVATGEPIGKPLQHVDYMKRTFGRPFPPMGIRVLAFSPDGRILLTGSGDDLVRWDTA